MFAAPLSAQSETSEDPSDTAGWLSPTANTLSAGIHFTLFTDYGSYSSIHTGFITEYTHKVMNYAIDNKNSITLDLGLRAGVAFEAGSDFPVVSGFRQFLSMSR